MTVSKIWVFAEASDGKVSNTTLEMLTKARELADTVECVKAYCQYVWDTYGRFPLTIDPMYQRLTTQAQHIDCGFYDQYYPPGAYSQQHANHMHLWHPEHA